MALGQNLFKLSPNQNLLQYTFGPGLSLKTDFHLRRQEPRWPGRLRVVLSVVPPDLVLPLRAGRELPSRRDVGDDVCHFRPSGSLYGALSP